MASAPIIGMAADAFEELDQEQRRAIQRAVQARAERRMPDYHVAMREIDRITAARVAMRSGAPVL